MPKTRAQKEELVNELAEKLGRIKGGAVASVHGYTMADADGLRTKGRESGVEFQVTKKTLLKRAIEKAGIEGLDPTALEGSLLFAFGYEDEVAPAKLINDLVKEKEDMRILAGVLEGVGIDGAQVTQLAALPSKIQLLGQLVGTINAPVSGFVNVLAGNIRGLMNTLNAIKEQKA